MQFRRLWRELSRIYHTDTVKMHQSSLGKKKARPRLVYNRAGFRLKHFSCTQTFRQWNEVRSSLRTTSSYQIHPRDKLDYRSCIRVKHIDELIINMYKSTVVVN